MMASGVRHFQILLLPMHFTLSLAFHGGAFSVPGPAHLERLHLHRLCSPAHESGATLHVRTREHGSRFIAQGQLAQGFPLMCKDRREGRIGSVTEEKTGIEQRRSHHEQRKVQEHTQEDEEHLEDHEDDLGHLFEDIQEDMQTIDDMPVQNDVSILICYSLSHAVVDIISQGPKESPGITMEDLVMIGRYFTNAASLGGAWMVAGFLTSHFRRKSRNPLQVSAEDIRVVTLTWLVAAPIVQIIRALGGADVGGFEGLRDTVAMLVVMVLWRCIEPFLYTGM